METIIIILGGIFIVVSMGVYISKKKKNKSEIDFPVHSSTISEIDILSDSNEGIEEITIDKPVDNIPTEMPIKPLPVNCKLGAFPPAPQKYSYVDCCGNRQEGMGYQPWEKRTPVPVNIVYEYEGMEIFKEEEAFQDCN